MSRAEGWCYSLILLLNSVVTPIRALKAIFREIFSNLFCPSCPWIRGQDTFRISVTAPFYYVAVLARLDIADILMSHFLLFYMPEGDPLIFLYARGRSPRAGIILYTICRPSMTRYSASMFRTSSGTYRFASQTRHERPSIAGDIPVLRARWLPLLSDR